jgi:hypothetical protein
VDEFTEGKSVQAAQIENGTEKAVKRGLPDLINTADDHQEDRMADDGNPNH